MRSTAREQGPIAAIRGVGRMARPVPGCDQRCSEGANWRPAESGDPGSANLRPLNRLHFAICSPYNIEYGSHRRNICHLECLDNCEREIRDQSETSGVSTESFFEESKQQSAVKTAIVSKYFWSWAKVIMPQAEKRSDPK